MRGRTMSAAVRMGQSARRCAIGGSLPIRLTLRHHAIMARIGCPVWGIDKDSNGGDLLHRWAPLVGGQKDFPGPPTG